jgi:hypothetical protein
MRKSIAFILALLLAVPAMAQAPQIQALGEAASGPYTDEVTGIIFPAAIGNFRRAQLRRGPGPESLFAGYAEPAEFSGVSVIAMRTPPALGAKGCEILAAGFRARTPERYFEAVVTDAEPPPVPGYRGMGFSARVLRAPGKPVIMDNYVYCAGNRLAYFTFSRPPDTDTAAQQKAFIAAFQLPVPA